MAQLKSIFLSLYLVLMTVVSISSIYVIASTGINVIWIGALLTSLPFLAFLLKITLFQDTPRTTASMPLLTLIIAAGFVIAIAAYILGGSVSYLHRNTVGAFAAFLCSVFYFLYQFWYARLDRSKSPELVKGNQLPEFELCDVDGQTISTKDFADRKTIYLFYRGNWCPLCMAQIKEVAAAYHELASMNVLIALISPQPTNHTRALAKKFDVPLHFYTDIDNTAAKQLGIEAKHGVPKGFEVLGYDSDTVMPTVIITDENNQIIYCDLTENYRVRPHPDDFIKALSSHPS